MIKGFRRKEQVENETPKNIQNDQNLHESVKNLTFCVKILEQKINDQNLANCVRKIEQKMMHLEGQLLIIEEL